MISDEGIPEIETTDVMIELAIDDLQYSDEYAEYILANCDGDRIVCNGDTLVRAMEDGYLFDAFIQHRNDIQYSRILKSR